MAHEIAVHEGLDRAFGAKAKAALLDAVWEHSHNTREMQEIITRYGLAAVDPETGEIDLDTLTPEARREAAEELLAVKGELFGSDIRTIYGENRHDIDTWSAGKYDLNDLRNIETRTREWMADTGYRPQQPSWIRQLLTKIRLFLRNIGLSHHELTDQDILNIIAIASRESRKRTRRAAVKAPSGGGRFAVENTNVNEIQKLDHSRYQENTMLSENADIKLIDIEQEFYTISGAEKYLAAKIKSASGRLSVVNKDQNMNILIRSNESLDEATSEKAVEETLADGTPAEIHAAAIVNIEKLLSEAKLGVSHRDWHVYAKNQIRGTKK